MTMSSMSKAGPDKPSGRYSIFAITCGVVFAIIYPLIMHYGWHLFTYYPAIGKFTLFAHPAGVPNAGPGMKWFGYVATASIVSVLAGLVVSLIPEKVLERFWWSGLIWLVPILGMIGVVFLIWVLGE